MRNKSSDNNLASNLADESEFTAFGISITCNCALGLDERGAWGDIAEASLRVGKR